MFKGVITALVTPFKKNGKIDYEALEKIIEMQVLSGVRGISPCGTTGESPTLSNQEHRQIIRFVVDKVNKRTNVIAGTGSNSTEEAINLTKFAEKYNADGALVVVPYYNKPTQKGLYLHFKTIANAVPHFPIMVYNIKGRCAVNLNTETLSKLMDEYINIISVKEASGDIQQMKDVIKIRRKGFSVLSGDDNLAIKLIKAGGDGVVSVASNIIPTIIVKMVDLALKRDAINLIAAENIKRNLRQFFKALFLEINPIPIKTMMAELGYIQEVFRLPLCSLEDIGNRKKIIKEMRKIRLIR